ncbi:MAG: hypothetical protein ACI9HI_001758, partial [Salinirussus sp.]
VVAVPRLLVEVVRAESFNHGGYSDGASKKVGDG